MDERLKTTARSGDIAALYTLIHDDPNVFKRLDEMEFVDTPLHESAVSGNTGFAMEMMNLKPSFARKLNPDGFSPIHLALLNGRTDTVTELVSVDKDLIRVKGRDGFTVLHYVACYGNVILLARFLKLCPECIFDLTTRRQTALHIAAENNRFEAFETMVEWIQRREKDNTRFLRSEILNQQDKDGNTALHLAAANNQPRMIGLLINCRETDKKKINIHGFTASDVLQRQTVADNRESLRVLNTKPSGFETKMSMFETIITDYFRELKPDTINALLVVLALVQAMTYQAILSPLGGVSQGGSNNSEVKSVLHWYLFLCFYIPNGVAFLMSWAITMMMFSVVVESIMPFLSPLYGLTFFCYTVAILVIAPTYAFGAAATLGVAIIVTLFYWIRGNRMMKH
ncbi:hypothetical protein like AT4G10720 [Hibiscus trionum]|uniref:PGG domain-containing protein n=1 Tax=Hibiscus trionum TaxID=183268 RepID=A0A9W7M675_HIBTR|nr:hypothetical protein like AT4G10720 [Hibiscus trionum]